jgi:hypothetical protein
MTGKIPTGEDYEIGQRSSISGGLYFFWISFGF